VISVLRGTGERFGGLGPTAALVAATLLATWMGAVNGGYFVAGWAPVLFVLSALALVLSLVGALASPGSRWTAAALGLFALYALWTALSMLWSPNKGDAWHGVGQTLLYLLAFWLALNLLRLGASRRAVLAASVLGPACVAALTFPTLSPNLEQLFENNRLVGSVGYYNGQAAFLLVPFWVAISLAGSPRIHWAVRGPILAGATLCLQLAVLTQSRGAMVALAVSLPIFFLFSGQRLRGLISLLPVVAALWVAFPPLNGVYLALAEGGDAAAAVERALPVVWLTSGGTGLFGLLWGLSDRAWRPPHALTRATGAAVLACCLLLVAVGSFASFESFGSPVEVAQGRWEAFRTNDVSGQEESRYLSASGSGRFELWRVAWASFVENPVRGIGTHNYEAAYYQSRELNVGYVRQPHSLPLEVLAERGAVGGVLLFAFLAACLVGGSLRRQRLNAHGKGFFGGLVASAAYWFVHSGAEWFWQMSAVTLPAVIYLAVLATPWRLPPDLSVAARWPVRLAAVGAALTVAVAVAPLFAADRLLHRGLETADGSEALAAVERAQRLVPWDPQLALWEAELAAREGRGERAETAYDRAIRLNPYHYAPYALLAANHQQTARPERAGALYREALRRNPLDPELQRAAAAPGKRG
jgi:O-antigen ligase